MRETYTVLTLREGRTWSIRVPGVRGAFSQAKERDKVEAMAREAVALILEVPEDSFDLTVREVNEAEWRAEDS